MIGLLLALSATRESEALFLRSGGNREDSRFAPGHIIACMWGALRAACRRRVRIYYSQSPFAVCFAFVRFLLTLPTLGPAKESTAFHPLQRGPSTRKARGEACVEGMSLSIRKTRPPADLRGRVTPARETQDSRKYGFDTIFSQSKLDLGRQKLSYSQYDSCGNTPGN